MHQAIAIGNNQWAHPSWWLFFGYYSGVEAPLKPDNFSESTIELGKDVWDDLMPLDCVPVWERNDYGSAFVHNLGNIKMKTQEPWDRWFHGCFQTVIWLGTATPSKRRQEKFEAQVKGHGGTTAKGGNKGKCTGGNKGNKGSKDTGKGSEAGKSRSPNRSRGDREPQSRAAPLDQRLLDLMT